MHLQARQYGYYDDDECYYDRYNRRICRSSAWNNWVRWVVLVVVVLGFLFLFMLCSCITARRRRRAGRQPFYGTGWAARPGTQQPYYGANTAPPATNQYNAATAPPYTAPNPNAGYYGAGQNQDYYGQQNGVHLQSPEATYGGPGGYAPPPGPPPGKATA